MNKEQLVEVLKRYRAELISDDELQNWVKLNASQIESFLSRGSFLKLKKGNALPACRDLIHVCEKCANIFVQGEFSTYQDFENCDDEIRKAQSNKVLKTLNEPQWSSLLPSVIGGVGFFECCHCGAIWQIVLPERSQRGSWHNVA